jgi:hypothetical protein
MRELETDICCDNHRMILLELRVTASAVVLVTCPRKGTLPLRSFVHASNALTSGQIASPFGLRRIENFRRYFLSTALQQLPER